MRTLALAVAGLLAGVFAAGFLAAVFLGAAGFLAVAALPAAAVFLGAAAFLAVAGFLVAAAFLGAATFFVVRAAGFAALPAAGLRVAVDLRAVLLFAAVLLRAVVFGAALAVARLAAGLAAVLRLVAAALVAVPALVAFLAAGLAAAVLRVVVDLVAAAFLGAAAGLRLLETFFTAFATAALTVAAAPLRAAGLLVVADRVAGLRAAAARLAAGFEVLLCVPRADRLPLPDDPAGFLALGMRQGLPLLDGSWMQGLAGGFTDRTGPIPAARTGFLQNGAKLSEIRNACQRGASWPRPGFTACVCFHALREL